MFSTPKQYAGVVTGNVVQLSISRGGIPKRAIGEGLLERTGLQGDLWAHPRIHGGPEQAILLLALEAIEELAARGFPVYPGALGENLTTSGLDRRLWRPGQQYRVGSATIELTKVRQPCATLDVFGKDRDGRPIQKAIYSAAVRRGDFAAHEWAASGFYARVLHGGLIRSGVAIALQSDRA